MNKSTKPVQAAIYARVSSDERATEGNSLNDQIARTTAEVERREGWTVRESYVERGFTGPKASRPEWNRLMQDAQDGVINAVVVTKWNRFPRRSAVG